MKTVTVRIPVAVSSKGQWCSTYGSQDTGDAGFIDRVKSETDGYDMDCDSIVWITAEVPIPEPVEVEGRVET